jgi:hypothetical protein
MSVLAALVFGGDDSRAMHARCVGDVSENVSCRAVNDHRVIAARHDKAHIFVNNEGKNTFSGALWRQIGLIEFERQRLADAQRPGVEQQDCEGLRRLTPWVMGMRGGLHLRLL